MLSLKNIKTETILRVMMRKIEFEGDTMKLYISDDGKLIEKDVVEKGWREVLVENEGKCYLIEVITIERLNGEYRYSAEIGEVMTLDQSTIIADSVAKERVIELLLKVDVSWITGLTPINLDTMFSNTFPHLSKIENWVCIFAD